MKKYTCLGEGAIIMDVICVREYPEGYEKQRKFVENVVIEEVGGTCGNVMSMLPSLGVQTFPVALLDQSETGYALKDSLEKYGADVRFVTNTPKGGTSICRCTHKRDKDGKKCASFRITSPGSIHPAYRFFNTRLGEDAAFLERLDFIPDVFFFDLQAKASENIARALREKGTLVYFEPEGIDKKSMNPFMNKVAVSDIIKFSAEKITEESWTKSFKDKLFLKTMGEKGVAFSLRGGDWQLVPVIPNENVVDTEGAGDWTTSAFIAELCKGGHMKVSELTEDIVRDLLEKAQAVSSKSVGYFAPKGMIHLKNN